MSRRILSLVVLVALLAMMVPAAAVGAPASDSPPRAPRVDDKPSPPADKQFALKEAALQKKLNGKAYGKVAEVARGQFVELAREGEDAVWTLPAEFADFAHNNLPEPDRAYDNSTIWVPDFGRDYYLDLLFADGPGANSMRAYYIEQSSGRYAVNGDVTEWVTVPEDAAYYDDSVGGEDTSENVWLFLEDSLDGWYQMQLDAGKTVGEIDAYLAGFDQWDRYDADADGDFGEPDGYIDHFQSLHAGEGEEAGGGALGDTAIWSHSWYARYQGWGNWGPETNPLGGIQIGDTAYWVGDYTIQPENGGVGVFVHEFGHDLGLPDLYDYYGENSTGFWTLMSSGSWLDDGLDTVGNKSSHMGAWEKFQLGWLTYDVARAGRRSSHLMTPMEITTKKAQGLFVILPPKPVTEHIADPYEGDKFYFSGSANNLRNRMTKAFTLGAGAMLTAKVNYGIEEGYDYANVIVSTNGGTTWQTVPTNLSNSSVEANGIEGSSGGAWVDLTADLSAYTGNVLLGFAYTSDGGVNFEGFMIDNMQVTGYPIDGAETDTGWTFTGFRTTSGTEDKLYSHYYVAEWRTYTGYDSTLKVGPYYFGYLDDPTLQNWVDHFAYQDGLLINYWDTSQRDNNTGLHPGKGLLLTVDAHPETLYRVDGIKWRNRIQTYDATFGLEATDGIPDIHHNSVLSPVPSLPAVPTFNDTLDYYDEVNNPLGSANVPNTATTITVSGFSALGTFMQVQVAPAK